MELQTETVALKKKKWVMGRELGACVVSFKRNSTTEWEMGIAIAQDIGTYDVFHIIDMDGKRVEDVVNYNLQQYDGAFRQIEWVEDK